MNRSYRSALLTALLAASFQLVALTGQAPSPVPIYPTSDARKDIDSALTQSAVDGKHVLLDFGADWCPDCRAVGKLFDDPAIAPFVRSSFHIVHVDIGRRDKNADIVAQYHATSDEWIPAIVVLDSRKNTVAVTDEKMRLTRRTTATELLTLLRQWAPRTLMRDLGGFTQHGVQVRVSLQEDASRQAWLNATFVPLAKDTHLYSKDLPIDGVNGLGRPTRLTLLSATGLVAIGDLVADRQPHDDRIEALDTTLSVYPAGAVSLGLPIRLIGNSGPRAELSISYMACGTNGCLPPVTNRRFTIASQE